MPKRERCTTTIVGCAGGATTTHLELTLAETLLLVPVTVQPKNMLTKPAGRQDTMETPQAEVDVVNISETHNQSEERDARDDDTQAKN